MPKASPLTTSEEITLRRLVYGQSHPSSLNAHDLQHLRRLGLVEGPLHAPVVTASGRHCFESLARPIALGETSIEQALADMLQSLRHGRQQRPGQRPGARQDKRRP